jgi:hypothetical protein
MRQKEGKVQVIQLSKVLENLNGVGSSPIWIDPLQILPSYIQAIFHPGVKTGSGE